MIDFKSFSLDKPNLAKAQHNNKISKTNNRFSSDDTVLQPDTKSLDVLQDQNLFPQELMERKTTKKINIFSLF